MQVQGQYPQQWAPFQVTGLLHAWQMSLWSIAESFHSLQSLSVSCFQVILGLPGPCFPTICMSKAVLTALLECSTCPYQRSLLSFIMKSRSSMPSHASSSVDLMLAVSCGLTLQICLIFQIIALSCRCRRWRLGFVNGQVSLAWSIGLRTQELYTRPRVLRERWWEERNGVSSLNFFQAVFTHVVVESSQPRLLIACPPGSKRKLPPPTCQTRLELHSVCRLRSVQFPGSMYICNQGPLSSA